MAKLFPPLVDGVIPAFCEDNGIVKLTVPFSLNRGVSKTQVAGIALKIKTVQSSSYLFTKEQKESLYFNLEDSPWVSFILSEDEVSKLRIGSFYKVQIAFINNIDEVGYYSSVGVIKYTTKPAMGINDFSASINNHTQQYTGFYNQEGKDTTERVYSYCFNIYDNLNQLIYTSGEQLHNTSNDSEEAKSYDIYDLNKDLPIDSIYKIKYTVTTTNGLTISTPTYRIVQKVSLQPELAATLEAKLDYNNGYIDVALVGVKDAEGLEILATGAFLLARTSEDSNYTEWNEISRFKLSAQPPSRKLWRDFTIEQGKNYRYSIQQYNDKGLYSERLLSNIINSDFEDAFLYDGDKQLRIRFNPKVTSFKIDTLEAKVDTLGGKHPFIMRNGESYYREFPISGLVSYIMDSDGLFEEINDYVSYDLVGENISKERQFKNNVLEWLTDGKPKLFRSPGEGNYIVRLMNVSMAPQDSLGRMLHTFSCTAYEVAQFNYQNLNNYNFISLKDPEVSQIRWETIMFTQQDKNGKYVYKSGEILNKYPAYIVQFNDMLPGDKVILVNNNGDEQIIQIGATGSYYIDLGVEIAGIKLAENVSMQGSMTYGFYSTYSNTFDKIDDISIEEIPMEQFIGEHNVIKEITCIQDDRGNWVENPKKELITILYVSAQKRLVEDLTKDSQGDYCLDKDGKVKFDEEEADPLTLYRIGTWQETPTSGTAGVGYNPSRVDYIFTTQHYKDFYNGVEYIDIKNADGSTTKAYNPTVQFGDSIISVEETENFDVIKPGLYDTIISGNGAIVNIAYQVRNIEYSIEKSSTYVNLPRYYKNYTDALQELEAALDAEKPQYTVIDEKRAAVQNTYRDYILMLIKAQELEKEAEGRL